MAGQGAVQSWRVVHASPWEPGTRVFALARPSAAGKPPLAYTLDVRVNRIPSDLRRVLGATAAEALAASEVVEGLVLFEDEEDALIFMDLAPDADSVFGVDGPGAVKAMTDADGVVVVVDEPPVPDYLREGLLSIAYDLGRAD